MISLFLFVAKILESVSVSVWVPVLGRCMTSPPPPPPPRPGYQLSQWRIPGVLQRFGITYFVVALTELLTVELYACCDHRQVSVEGLDWVVVDFFISTVYTVLIKKSPQNLAIYYYQVQTN